MLEAGKLSQCSDSQHEPWRVAVGAAGDEKALRQHRSVAESALTRSRQGN